jgi:methylated-DNA-protein-cysteine methyltransferase related protein
MPASRPRLDSESRTARILARVRAIPEGFVRTYGDIDPGAPRMVGAVLAGLERDDVPWHRVVRSDGTLAKGEDQLQRLCAEGVPFRRGRVDLRLARLPPEAV